MFSNPRRPTSLSHIAAAQEAFPEPIRTTPTCESAIVEQNHPVSSFNWDEISFPSDAAAPDLIRPCRPDIYEGVKPARQRDPTKPPLLSPAFTENARFTVTSGGPWSALGNASVNIITGLLTATPSAIVVGALSALTHLALGAFALRNHLCQRGAFGSSPRDQLTTSFHGGWDGYVLDLARSPGVQWCTVALVSLCNAGSMAVSGEFLTGIMYASFAIGQVGAASIEDARYNYWDRRRLALNLPPASKGLIQRAKNGTLAHPEIPWCAGDIIAGIIIIPAAAILTQPAVGVPVAIGIGLGIYGVCRSLWSISTGSKDSSAAISGVRINGFQNFSFSVANREVGSWMAIPLAFWGISSVLISIAMRKDVKRADDALQPALLESAREDKIGALPF